MVKFAILNFALLASATAAFSCQVAFAQQADTKAEWPGWLGPERNGWVADFEPPAKWPEKLTKAWEVPVGSGYGTPLVADGVVFQHARVGENELVWAVEIETGEVKWRRGGQVLFKAAGGGEWHGTGPKSSPVYDNGMIYTMSITGTLTAIDARVGGALWSRNYNKEFGKSHPNWGASTSPIVDGKKVISHFGTDEKGALVALDIESGAEVWKQGTAGASYSSPILVDIAGVRQVVEWNHESLVGVESESGKLLWSTPFPHDGSNQNMPTPIAYKAADGVRILLGGENRGITSLQPNLKDGEWSVEKNWFQKEVALDMSTAVINGEYLFGMSHYKQGRFFSLDPKTGEILWQSEGRVGKNVAFLSIPNQIIALRDNGNLEILAAQSDAYKQLANYKVSDNTTWAPPVLLDNGFLIKDEKLLTLWTFEKSESE